MIKEFENRLERGLCISKEEMLNLIRNNNVDDIYELAHRVTRRFCGDSFDTCSIINAKSGNCSEDCKWCSQSSYHSCDVDTYELLNSDECVEMAEFNSRHGIRRFSLVSSGKRLSKRDVAKVCDIVMDLKRKTNVIPCVSLGLIDDDDMRMLAQAGVKRYHCNIESSASFFPKLCTTHTMDEKLTVIRNAIKHGIEPCSGGIIGMGESVEDIVDMALMLRDEGVLSIPINILNPIKGTKLENQKLIEPEEYLLTIAIFRIINPRAELRFSGGRALISGELQEKALYIGINAAIMGDMLTTIGSNSGDDIKTFEKMGYRCEKESVRDHIWHPYSAVPNQLPTFWVDSANGVRLKLKDGRELIDGMSSWWAAVLGYNNEFLNRAIQNQLEKMSHVMFGGIVHDPAIALTETLLSVLPTGLAKGESKIFYTDSGSVAVEVAMKMAIQYQVGRGFGGKTAFATVRGGYHGDTWNAMSVCDPVNGMHSIFGTALPINYFLPRPISKFGEACQRADYEALEALLIESGDKIAGFIIEPVVQGAGGMYFYSADYLVKAKELCAKYDVLLIFDEIATGFGRTGQLFACQHAGITPDIMTIGKALTGGYMTLGATIASNCVAEVISTMGLGLFMHGPTFMANPLACAVANEAVSQYKKMNVLESVKRIESGMRAGLSHLSKIEGVVEVRILGAIGVVELENRVDMAILQPMFVENGIWIRPFGKLVYMMPPFIISDEDLAHLCVAFSKTLVEYFKVIS